MPRLRRSDWREPGITRRRHGSGHTYVNARGERVVDTATIRRIKSLAIPPAWSEVWICSQPHGHLQAVGFDDAGRRQYLYHEKWRTQRDDKKHAEAQVLGRHLPALRRREGQHLKSKGINRDRVLATAVRLLDLGLFRVGGERYAAENESFGLATLQRDHVISARTGVEFEYPAKSGQTSRFVITEPSVCRAVRDLLKRADGSDELLGWWDPASHSWRDVRSEHINEHLKSVVAEETTAKDFRTWHGTVLMSMHLSEVVHAGDPITGSRLTSLYREVAAELGNTGTVARNSYVNPKVVDLAEQGLVIGRVRRQPHELVPLSASTAVLHLLQEHMLIKVDQG